MFLFKRIPALLLFFTLNIFTAVNDASAELLVIETAGYRIKSGHQNADYAANLSSVLDTYFFEICRFIGYKPDYRIHIRIYNSSEKSLPYFIPLLNGGSELSVYADYEYRRNLDLIHRYTVDRILSDLSSRQRSLRSIIAGNIDSQVYTAVSRYIVYGLESRDEKYIRGILLRNDPLSISHESLRKYTSREREALAAAFIHFSREFYGDRVLSIALKNLTWYGGLVEAHEKITGFSADMIISEFNSFYLKRYRSVIEKEAALLKEPAIDDIDGNTILSSDMEGRILYSNTIGNITRFFITDHLTDNSLIETGRINIDKSEVTNIAGAFIKGGGIATAVTMLNGTIFLVYGDDITKPDVNIFIPYIFALELKENQLPGALVFSASEGTRRGMFTLDLESMQITRISDSNGNGRSSGADINKLKKNHIQDKQGHKYQ